MTDKIHSPSFWLGAHLTLVVVCLMLAPVTNWLTLLSTIPSALCLWANWQANFRGSASVGGGQGS